MGKCPIILVSVVRVLFPPFPKRRIAALTGYWRIRVTMYVVLVDMLTYWLWSFFFLALLFSCFNWYWLPSSLIPGSICPLLRPLFYCISEIEWCRKIDEGRASMLQLRIPASFDVSFCCFFVIWSERENNMTNCLRFVDFLPFSPTWVTRLITCV